MDVKLIQSMGTDKTVVNAARVSFKKKVLQVEEKDVKLIHYLARNKHWTPFAHTAATFHIKAPIFVARQLYKHKVGGAENEVSRRYVEDEPEFFYPEFRERVANVKQGSGEALDVPKQDHLTQQIQDHCRQSINLYNYFLYHGVAPEQARIVLPQNMYTEWYWTGSMVFWARLCNQRLDPHAQKETRQVAEKISEYCYNLWPISWSALVPLGREVQSNGEDGCHVV